MKIYFTKTHLLLLLPILIFGAGGIGYLGYQNYQLKQHKLTLGEELSKTKLELASTTQSLKTTIGSLEQNLNQTKGERDDLEQKLLDEKTRINTIATQVQGITGVVGTLEKLSKIDPQLLQKYSKVYFLNEHYVPSKLTKIDEKYVSDQKKEYLIYTDIWPFLQNLLENATRAKVDMQIISAYRSFGTQAELKSSYAVVYGAGTANQFSADQGYSEHQLGTAVDFTTTSLGTSFSSFAKTPAYQWLAENAHTYGFILSYPKDNAYYKFEPWHWRFVGRELAGKLHLENKYFYDLEQRLIDTYLLPFFN